MKLVNEQIQYIEFLSLDFKAIEKFYQTIFGWEFVDYGPEYLAFTGENVDGGFAVGEPKRGSILVIIYSEDLKKTREKVLVAGGEITKDIFSFPGGSRFQFLDIDGNELAVWSDR